MSKAIKFRAWTGQEMIYQEKQYLASFIGRIVPKIMLHHGIDDFRQHESYLPNGGDISEYLTQFTGLTDMAGREIYEGDIVTLAHNDGQWIIEWDEDGYHRANPARTYFLAGIDAEQCTVIGNIYETSSEETTP